MSQTVAHMLPLLLAATAGLALGCGWCSIYRWVFADLPAGGDGVDADQLQVQSRQAKQSLTWLRQLVDKVDRDVEDHRQALQQISADLVHAGGNSAAATLRLLELNQRTAEQLRLAKSRLDQQAQTVDSHFADSRVDTLTGLSNRRGFGEQMAYLLHRLQGQNEPAALLLIELDHFGRYSDTYGHVAGDEIAQNVADVLRKEVRAGEISARYDDAKFVIVFPGLSAANARFAAERIRKAIASRTFILAGNDVYPTASSGLAQMLPGDSCEAVVERADQALSTSIHAGGNRGHWCHDGQLLPLTQPEEIAAVRERPRPTMSPSVADSNAQPASFEHDPQLDPVTGLPVVTAFNEKLANEIVDARRANTALSAMIMRIDRFQGLSARFGTQMAELVLRKTSEALRATALPSYYLARYSSDSIAVLMPDADLAAAVEIAYAMQLAVEGVQISVGERNLRLTLSIGVAECESHDGSPMIDRALEGAAHATNKQGNKVVCDRGEGFEIVAGESRGSQPALAG